MIDIRTYFNSIAGKWDNRNKEIPAGKIRHILDIADVQPGDAVLDIGTGTGVLLPFLAERQRQAEILYAVDVSAAMLDIAYRKNRRLSPQPTFILADAETDIIHGIFNRIMLYCVYPHLKHPVATLTRLYRDNLIQGGTITIAHPASRLSVNDIHRNSTAPWKPLIPAQELASRLADAGLNVDYTEDSDEYYIIKITKL